MNPTTGLDPESRMGAFKRLSDVPQRYRLDTPEIEAAFEDRNVWAEWTAEDVPDKGEKYHEQAERCGRRWKRHCEHHGVHHALATPEVVNSYIVGLLNGMSLMHCYKSYWTKLERFFRWLMYHTDYPHMYSPVMMAATEYPEAGEVWHYKITRYHDA